ncbi:coagulation factor V isoform X2 [Protopterus annectens]|uniref:coagulation factor V isoform X2 n=1 Tax=Protopterus annectens TaxID=7888 RepID=UPI001CFA7AA9|nr:coagulation factor V isoform X2 [Protopterus annectens]
MGTGMEGLTSLRKVQLLLLWAFLAVTVRQVVGVQREHNIAAVIREWNYRPRQTLSLSDFISPKGPRPWHDLRNNPPTLVHHESYPKSSKQKSLPLSRGTNEDTTYRKVLYREYNADFTEMKETPEWTGLLGPTLRGEVGDVLIVHFKNMADRNYTIHPQGIIYGKQAEGSPYQDTTSIAEKKDDGIPPGGMYTYVWEITEDIGPTVADPPCLTYSYYSHVNLVNDLNSGLIGALLVCRNGSLDEDGNQKLYDQEYILMFGIFDENKSWQNSKSVQQKSSMYSINGYINGTLPELVTCLYSNISWHFLGVGSDPELFSIHFNGQVLEQNGHRISTVSLITSSSATANMAVKHKGKWLLSSFVPSHIEAGMHGYLTVKQCENVSPQIKAASSLRIITSTWKYYIAAQEVSWDYAPSIPKLIDKDYKALYLDRGPHRIGKTYKKAVYREYIDGTFTKQVENTRPNETGILGPIIRAQIRDKIIVVFKNMASRPYSLYPHGLSISKEYEGANYPPDVTGLKMQMREVQPGEVYTYEWIVYPEDGPTAKDQRCLTRLYHSAVDVTRDIASGLIGPLLICKTKSLDTRGLQRKADVEQQAVFAVFDENRSWYLQESINKSCTDPSHVDKNNPWFYKSNVMHTINGFVYESIPFLGFCRDNVVFWHISSIGAMDDTLAVHFNGHTFEHKKKNEDVLTLFPMSGETVSMEMDNVGEWLFGALGLHQTNLGMRQKFRDVVCRGGTSDEDSDEIDQQMTVIRIKYDEEKEKKEVSQKATEDPDEDTEKWADFLNLRTQKNSSGLIADEDLLDLNNLNSLNELVAENVNTALNSEYSGMSELMDYDYSDSENSTADTEEPLSSFNESDIELSLNKICSLVFGLDEENSTTSEINNTNTVITAKRENETDHYETSDQILEFQQKFEDLINISIASRDAEVKQEKGKNMSVSAGLHPVNSSFVSPEQQPNNLSTECKDPVCEVSLSEDDEYSDLPMNEYHTDAENSTDVEPHEREEEPEENNDADTDLVNNGSKTWTVAIGPTIFEQHKPNHPTAEASRTLINLNESSVLSTYISKAEDSVDSGNYPDLIEHLDYNTSIQEKHSEFHSIIQEVLPEQTLQPESHQGRENITELNESFVLSIHDLNATEENVVVESSGNLQPSGTSATQLEDHIELQEMPDPDYSQINTDQILKNMSDAWLSLDYINNDDNATVDIKDSYPLAVEEYQGSESQYINVSMQVQVRPNETSSGETNSDSTEIIVDLIANSTFPDNVAVNQTDRLADNILAIYISKVEDSVDSGNYPNLREHLDYNTSSQEKHSEFHSVIQEVIPEQTLPLESYQGRQNITELYEAGNSFSSAYDRVISGLAENNFSQGCFNSQCTVHASVSEADNNQLKVINKSLSSVVPGHTSQEDSLSLQDDLLLVPANSTYVLQPEVQKINNMSATNADGLKNMSADFFQKLDSKDSLLLNQSNNSKSYYQNGQFLPEYDSYDDAEDIHIYVQKGSKEKERLMVQTKALPVDKKQWTYLGKEDHKEVNNLSHLRKYIDLCKKKRTKNKKMKNPSLRSIKFRRKIVKNNADGFAPRGSKPSISIGLPGSKQGDYVEYDVEHQTMFKSSLQDPFQQNYEYVEYDDPYTTDFRTDSANPRNPTSIAEKYQTLGKGSTLTYYIAAEEVYWNYEENKLPGKRAYENLYRRRREERYKKVVFRSYYDNTFKNPVVRGELEEHLGILGPVIRAEVDDVINIVFKNLASRPYSIHAHGVSYEKSSEGVGYDDSSQDWYKADDAIAPNQTYSYVWYVKKNSGPESQEATCKTWTYYSNVHLEKDIHSGLIGPLIICKKGTLHTSTSRPMDAREFVLLFMTFDENKSWYYEENSQSVCNVARENYLSEGRCKKFHAINGIVYNLQGLMMFSDELVRWHLLNMGGPKDFHVIHFHGQSFTEKHINEHRLGVFPLFPGTFGTVEMKPSKPGLWLLDTEVGEYQQAGMQSLFFIVDKECKQPFGLESGSIRDYQITASHVTDGWYSYLARLNKDGKYNAWSATLEPETSVWIQVDFRRPVLITEIATQGAKRFLSSMYITKYVVSYSKDGKRWTLYKGNSTMPQKFFEGNNNAYGIKQNSFDPPIHARYIRVHPTNYYGRLALRMELYGCDLDSCSAPLGMESGLIKNEQITATSFKPAWFGYSWAPHLARLNMKGNINAWQAKASNFQWLQIDLQQVMKITGIITQGASYFKTEMYLKSFALHYSNDGTTWTPHSEEADGVEKVFTGNVDSQTHAKNYIDPPIFSRFIRIIPRTWQNSITLRVELLGCDNE